MRIIKLKIDDDVFKNLKRSLFTKAIATGLSGISDAVLKKVIDAIKDGEKEIHLKYKNNNGNVT